MNELNRNVFEFLSVFPVAGPALVILYSFILGACFGSFSTACVWRIPRGISILWPPSSCPNCQHRITPGENIPLLSYLLLRGRCSGCHQKISPRYFFLELTTALLFTLFGVLTMLFTQERMLSVIPLWILTVYSLACACTDWELRIIPDKFTFTAMFLGILWGWLMPSCGFTPVRGIIYAAASAGAVMLVLWGIARFGKALCGREALGMGDVKFLGGAAALGGVFAGTGICAAASLLALLWLLADRLRRGRWRRTFPFGPFLAAGTIVWCILSFFIRSFCPLS